MFDWIVSDFGLNDAIESGLVKTPRVVVRDDGRLTADYKSRLYHIYNDPEVKDDLNRKAEPQEPLPDLVTNGYYLLGKDWLETANEWQAAGHKTPPVMITVANRTETAARVKYAFDRGKIRIDELCTARADAAHRLEGARRQAESARRRPRSTVSPTATNLTRTRATRRRASEADQGPAGRAAAADGRHGGQDRASRASRFRTSSRSACSPRAGTPRP